MDDGEVDFSDRDFFADCSDLSPPPGSMESFLDELLKNTHSCTHTHTCNPPGPDSNTHTHTCFHTHTQLFGPLEDKDHSSSAPSEPSLSSGKKRPLGNREAVRKYREKKKAHTAFLEQQVLHLRTLNQQLLRRLQAQAALEAEVVRLRQLLSEFRGRIDAELRLPPASVEAVTVDPALQMGHALPGGYFLNAVNVPCDADVPCFHSWMGNVTGPPTPQEHRLPGRSCDTAVDNCHGCRKKQRRKDSKVDNRTGSADCVREAVPD